MHVPMQFIFESMSSSSPTCKCRQGTCYNCNKCKRCGCTCLVTQRKSQFTGDLELKTHADNDVVQEVEEAMPIIVASKKRKQCENVQVTPRKSPPPSKRRTLQSRSEIERATIASNDSTSKTNKICPIKSTSDTCKAFSFEKMREETYLLNLNEK